MRFRWLKQASEQAVVCMSYARNSCTKMTVEEAVKATLATGRHCVNHESISDRQFNRLCKQVKRLRGAKHARADAR